MDWRVVEFVIEHGTSPILNSILDRCDDNDDN